MMTTTRELSEHDWHEAITALLRRSVDNDIQEQLLLQSDHPGTLHDRDARVLEIVDRSLIAAPFPNDEFQPCVSIEPIFEKDEPVEREYALMEDIQYFKRHFVRQKVPVQNFPSFWKFLKATISMSWRIIGHGKVVDDHLLYNPELIFTRKGGLSMQNLRGSVNGRDYFVGPVALVRFLLEQFRIWGEIDLAEHIRPLIDQIQYMQAEMNIPSSHDNVYGRGWNENAIMRRVGNANNNILIPSHFESHSIFNVPPVRMRQKRSRAYTTSLSATSSSEKDNDRAMSIKKRKIVRKNNKQSASNDEYSSGISFTSGCISSNEPFRSSVEEDSSFVDDDESSYSPSMRSFGKGDGRICEGPGFQVSVIPECRPKPSSLSAEQYAALTANRVWTIDCLSRVDGQESSDDDDDPDRVQGKEKTLCEFLRIAMARALRRKCWTGNYQPSFRSDTQPLVASTVSLGAPVHAIGTVCLFLLHLPESEHSIQTKLGCIVTYAEEKGYNSLSDNDISSGDHGSFVLRSAGEVPIPRNQSDNRWNYVMFDGESSNLIIHPKDIVRALPHLSPSFPLLLQHKVHGSNLVNEEALLRLLHELNGNVERASRMWKRLCKHRNAERSHLSSSAKSLLLERSMNEEAGQLFTCNERVWSVSEMTKLLDCWQPRTSQPGAKFPPWMEKQLREGSLCPFDVDRDVGDMDCFVPPLRDWQLRIYETSKNVLKRSKCSFLADFASLFPSFVRGEGRLCLRVLEKAWEINSLEEGDGDLSAEQFN